MSLHLDFTAVAANYYIGNTLVLSVPIDPIIIDTDRLLRFQLLAPGATAAQIVAGTAIPEDASTKQFSWTVRKHAKSADVLIEKTNGSGITVTGVFDADPLANTQWIEVLLEDTDTYDPTASPPVHLRDGTYAHALKCVETGEEDVKAWGKLVLIETAAREVP